MSKRSPVREVSTARAPAIPGEGHNRALVAVVMGGTALLLLFAWLHLFVATQITSTNRDIQEANREVRRIERENDRLERDIALAEAQQAMSDRAAALGYGPQLPVYVKVHEEIEVGSGTETSGEAAASSGPSLAAAGNPTGAGVGNPAAQLLLEAGTGRGTP